MEITPLLPDGYAGEIKRIKCELCKRYFYVTKEYFTEMQPTHCHECSEIFAPKVPKRAIIATELATNNEEELHAEGAKHWFKTPWYALNFFEKAARLFPDNPKNYYYCALLLSRLKRYTDAIEACSKAINLDPAYSHAYTIIGDCYVQLKNFQQALLFYDKAITLEDEDGYVGKGDVYVALGDYERAFFWYAQVDTLKASYHTIELLTTLDRLEEAEAIHKELLTKYPENTEVYTHYEVFLVLQHKIKDLKQLIEMRRKFTSSQGK
jgi:tetratricopeptide (TPR) repeat protein